MFVCILSKATLALDGILAGIFVCSGLVEHAMRKLSGDSWLDYKQAKEHVFGPIMPVFFGIALLATTISAFVASAHFAIATAAALLVAALVITMRVHLPLNAAFQRWTGDTMPEDWDRKRRQWRRWNWARTALVVVAFCAIQSICLFSVAHTAAPATCAPVTAAPTRPCPGAMAFTKYITPTPRIVATPVSGILASERPRD